MKQSESGMMNIWGLVGHPCNDDDCVKHHRFRSCHATTIHVEVGPTHNSTSTALAKQKAAPS